MSDELELVDRGADPFVDLPNGQVLRLKADLATALLRVMRTRKLSLRAAAKLADVDHSDIARIRNLDLERFTIDRLYRIVHRLDARIRLEVSQSEDTKAA